MIKFNIITRCTRLKNLTEIYESVFNSDKFDIKWYIVFDTNFVKEISVEIIQLLNDPRIIQKYQQSINGDHGHQSINKCLDEITNGWVYVLDDDNLIHPNFYDKLSDTISSNPEFSGFIFNQKIGGIDFTGQDVRYGAHENVQVSKIDMAQFVLNKSLIGEKRLVMGQYVADGIFIQDLYNSNIDKFFFIDEILCYYNYFQQNKKPNKKFLPRVLLLGLEEDIELKSKYYADFESTEIFTQTLATDEKIDELITSFDPDTIVTIKDSYEKFPVLLDKSFDIRRRWIHFSELKEQVGDAAYYCASNYILTPHYTENPLVSFFTPIYNTGTKLWRTYESIKNQIYKNWEWVLVNDSNDGGITLRIAEEISKIDSRVKVYDFHNKTGGIVGESKYRAACLCNGIYLMEMDHDDVLTPDAALLMVEAFQKYPDCKFVYSDFAEIDENHNSLTYGDSFSFGYGSYRDEEYNGKNYKTVNTSNLNPKTIRHIVGVPNHFRAWERFFYHSIGGHNRRLSIADDYELIVRTFLNTKMVRIPKLLYLQFYHNSNTQNATRKDIQRRVRTISNFYNERIKQRFNELGLEDWAYNYDKINPLNAPSLFGEGENSVNYTMSLNNSQFIYDWNSIVNN
jgi:glycosyltransferase involved in cell wall biosynthesis